MNRRVWKLGGSNLDALRAELDGIEPRQVSFADDGGPLKITVTTPATDGRSERVWVTHARAIPSAVES